MTAVADKKFMLFILLSTSLMFGSGCAGLALHPIYSSAIGGALLGGIIGHQSGEAAAGALVGAAITGTGKLLEQTDKMAKKEQKAEQEKHTVIVEVTNCNGSFTPVKLKKKGDVYIGPKGEHYRDLPTQKQLAPFYGLPPDACGEYGQKHI